MHFGSRILLGELEHFDNYLILTLMLVGYVYFEKNISKAEVTN